MITGFHFSGVTSGEVRVFADRDFTTSDGKLIMAGVPSVSNGFYYSFGFTVSGSTLSLSAGSLDSTIDASVHPSVRYNAYFFDSLGRLLGPYQPFQNFQVSNIWSGYDGTCAGNPQCSTWDAIAVFNSGTVPMPFTYDTYNKTQILALLAQVNTSTMAPVAPLVYDSMTHLLSIPKSTSLVDGYLAATDFAIFAGKASPFTVTGGGLTYASNQIGLTQAGSGSLGYLSSTDWSTFNNKENVLTFGPSPVLTRTLNAITLQQADASNSGYLTSANWNTFNNKQSTVTASLPLTIATNNLTISQAGVATNGYLSSTDWNTFNNKEQVLTFAPGSAFSKASGTVTLAKAATGQDGYLSLTDWNTFNNKQSTVSATPPLTFASNTVALPKATSGADGYLSMGDWSTFNGKQSAISFALPLSNGSGTISISQANTTTNGYLTSGDWNTFNNKEQVLTFAPGSVVTKASGTVTIARSSASQDGYLAQTDFSTFAAKENALTFAPSSALSRASNTITLARSSGSQDGYLHQSDFSAFSAKESALTFSTGLNRSVNTISVVADTTVQQHIYQDQTDAAISTRSRLKFVNGGPLTWTIADDAGNNRATATPVFSTSPAAATTVVGTARQILTDSTLSGGGNLSADRTLGVVDNTSIQKINVYGNGSLVATKKDLNFTGAGVSTSLNLGTGNIDVTITGVSSGVSTLTGTANQITVSASTGAVTLSIPTTLSNPVVNTTTGFRYNGSATSGQFLRGDGSNFVDAPIGINDLPTITVAKGGTNLTGLGAANTILGVNSAGTSLEYKTISLASLIPDSQGGTSSFASSTAANTIYTYAVPASTLGNNGFTTTRILVEVANTSGTARNFTFVASINGTTVASKILSIAGTITNMWIPIDIEFFNQGAPNLNSANFIIEYQTTTENTTPATAMVEKAYKAGLNVDTAAGSTTILLTIQMGASAPTVNCGLRHGHTLVRP